MISFLIVVPTRNSYKILSNLVDSLVSQTYSYWRVHFVDGSSNPDHIDFLNYVCNYDHRFSWRQQISSDGGIFGAMNEGIADVARDTDWILFWGSDDRASSPLMLELIASKLNIYTSHRIHVDLLVCMGTYFHISNDSEVNTIHLGRKTFFKLGHSYRRSLFLGSTPPHQATFFGPSALGLLGQFSTELKLAADLDYFLQLSAFPSIKVVTHNENVVLIGDAGISTKQTKHRLAEVKQAYENSFKYVWWIPFAMRYLRRIMTILFLR